MKKIGIFTLSIISTLLIIFFYFKISIENKSKEFIKSNYKNVQIETINCINFLSDICLLNNVSYKTGTEEILVKEITIYNISEIDNIINKKVKNAKLNTFKIKASNFSIKSENQLFNQINDLTKNKDFMLEYNVFNDNGSMYSQINLNSNLGLFSITNKLNLVEKDKKKQIINNNFSLYLNKTDILNVIHLAYEEEYTKSKDKLSFNSLFGQEYPEKINKDVFFNLVQTTIKLFISQIDLNNNTLNILNKNNQFIKLLNNFINNEKISFSINIKNENKFSNKEIFDAIQIFISEKTINNTLKNISIEII